MINVQMTRNIMDRPPKIFGLFTKRQLLGLIIAFVVAAVLMIIIPLDFTLRLLIGIVPAIPIIIIAFYPENETSPLSYLKFYLSVLINGNMVKVHDGDSVYYRKRSTKKEKIKRYRNYRGIK